MWCDSHRFQNHSQRAIMYRERMQYCVVYAWKFSTLEIRAGNYWVKFTVSLLAI